MTIAVSRVPFEEVLPLRELYRQEMNCQIVHDSLPRRGFGNLFLLRLDGRVAGYGFVMGYHGEPKDMIQEFFVLQPIGARRCRFSGSSSKPARPGGLKPRPTTSSLRSCSMTVPATSKARRWFFTTP